MFRSPANFITPPGNELAPDDIPRRQSRHGCKGFCYTVGATTYDDNHSRFRLAAAEVVLGFDEATDGRFGIHGLYYDQRFDFAKAQAMITAAITQSRAPKKAKI